MRMTKQLLIGRVLCLVCAAVLLTAASGCVVGQPRGKGKAKLFREPQTKTAYWLYLPEDYLSTNGKRPDGKKWPMVMTFHGMKPFDSYTAQIEEWQEEADRYGFIVCAPNMHHASLMDTYPIESETDDFKEDADNILAVMNDVFSKTEADPTRVLSTGWSQGGYMAHYIVNRHPEMFAVIVVKQCNFSSEVMNASRARRYSDMPIGIYYTENDFGICQRESAEAVTWYSQLGFKNLTSGVIDRYGHERMPEVAADLFAKYIGAPPKTPPQRLVRIKTQDMPGQRVAAANTQGPPNGGVYQSQPPTTRSRPDNVNYNEMKPPSRRQPSPQQANGSRPPRTRPSPPPPNTRNQLNQQRVAAANETPQRRTNTRTVNQPAPNNDRVQRPVPPPPTQSRSMPDPRVAQAPQATRRPPVSRANPTNSQPRRNTRMASAPRNPSPQQTPRTAPPNAARRQVPPPTRPTGTVGIDLSSTIGLSPLMVSYSVNLPRDQLRGADILWTDNGEPFSQTPNGQRVLTQVGDHEIGVIVVTAQGMELRQTQKVTVYPRDQVGGIARR